MNRQMVWVVILGILVLGALQFFRSPDTNTASVNPVSSSEKNVNPNSNNNSQTLVVKNVKVYDLDGRLAYQGDVNLAPVLDRIARGVKDSHRNDGVVHRNREHKLPVKNDPEYYREYVVRTPGLKSVGPQRVIVGKGGEAYYTPDHYKTFIRVR